MNSIKKILSSTLATAVVLSCCAINVFAAPSAHTYTVSADKAENLAAGDVVTVEVKIDSTENLFSAGYELTFDPAVFTIDTASGGRGKPKKYVDEAFNKDITNTDGAWGWYLGAPTVGESATEGFIKYAWGGNTGAGSGVIADDNLTDYTIGKFFLIVKDDAAEGKTKIDISGVTAGYGENTADTMTYVPVEVTVGNAGPSDIPVEAIKLDQTAVELDLNGTKTATLTATVEPADATDPTVTWATSDENVATVVDGVVTAVATGEATITATAGEKSATCVVTVVDTTPKTLKPGDVIEGIDIAKNPGKEDNVFYYVKTVADGANAAGHAKITNVTLDKSVTTSRTIAQLLGGEAAEGATIEGAIVVVISGPVDNAFDFEIVD